jgi:hypothetical protein
MQQAREHAGDFVIRRWQAWAPGIESATDWGAWLARKVTAPTEAQPDVSQLPALLRRRLDRLGRMALHTAWPCLEGLNAAVFVFASRHGSFRRTLELLGTLAHNELISPTVFSVSVHNGTAGLYAIARSDHSSATAISAGQDTLSMGLLEGTSMIAAGTKHVLVCYADDSLPPPYDVVAGSGGARAPFSISLLLEPVTQDADVCHLAPAIGAASEAPETALLRFLAEHQASAVIGVEQRWRLERNVNAG